MPSELTPYILLGALGISIGASNVLGMLCFSEWLRQEQLPLALSFRSLIGMAASAVVAAIAGEMLDIEGGWAALLLALGVALLLAWASLGWRYGHAFHPHDPLKSRNGP
jgi:hypothetical protein